MKRILYIITAGLLCMAVACNDKETYKPGEPEEDGCIGVFFPTQEASTTHYFEPAGEKNITITVKRTNAEGAVDVPFTMLGENVSVYDADEFIHFDDAQEETTMTISLNDNAEQAVAYPLTIEIQDPMFASKYSSNNAFISLSTMIVTWETLGTFTFEDYWWGESHVAEVVYYDIDGVRTCKTQNEREPKSLEEDAQAGTDGGFWGTGDDYHLQFKWYTNHQNSEGYDYVELPVTYFGFDNPSLGPVYLCDYLNYYQLNGRLTSYDFASYVEAGNPNSLTLPYYDPRGELFFYFATPIGTTGYWYGAGRIVGLKEGYIPTDYSLTLAPDVTQNGVVPIAVTTGEDVAFLNYIVYEGALGKAVVGDHVAAIMKGTEVPTKVALESTTSTLEITLENSGEYTIIVIPSNADGELQEANYAYAVFNFLAAGDENPVDGHAGIETLSDKYIAQNISPETSLEVWMYGKQITSAKFLVVKEKDFTSVDEGTYEQLVKERGNSITGDDLEALNAEGFSVIINQLLPGTSYVLIAYMSNGYEEVWIHDTAFTAGDPNPLTVDWSAGDFVNVVNKEDFIAKEWDLYGRGLSRSGFASERAKIGVVSAEDGGVVDEEDILILKGLSLGAGARYGFDDALETDVYNGVIYTHKTDYGMVNIGGSDYYVDAEFHTSDDKAYVANYALVGAYVDDGLIAMTASPSYIQSYNIAFDGVLYQAWTDDTDSAELVGTLSGVLDIIFADPDVFQNEQEVSAAIARSQGRINTFKCLRGEYLNEVSKDDIRFHDVNNSILKKVPFCSKAVNARVKLRGATRVSPKNAGAKRITF